MTTTPIVRKDLKALCETNRRLCIVASERLFESITITTNSASFVRLLNIVASDVWSAQVRYLNWVLMREFYGLPALAQNLSFNTSWDTSLKQWGVYETRRPFYDGLDLQCQLAKRLSNVQIVRFWNASISQREGMKLWEIEPFLSCDEITSIEIFENDVTQQNLNPGNAFSVLQLSDLKPRIVETYLCTLHLEYSRDKKLESMQIQRSLRPFKYRDYRETERKMLIYQYFPDFFQSLAANGLRHLRILGICGGFMSLSDIEILLDVSSNLRELNIGARMSSTDGAMLLPLLQRYHHQGRLHGLKVAFQNLTYYGRLGSVSASGQQVQASIEGKDDGLLKNTLSAYAHRYEPGRRRSWLGRA